jgi:uncharacterized protein (TIGR02453 family)
MSLQVTLDFLSQLIDNNNKAWFDAHRAEYARARGAFEATVEDIIRGFEPIDDLGFVTAKQCIFRINRDVRFSKDKSPYKTNMSAVIAKGGRKSEGRSYYLQIGPGNSFMGGGLYDVDRTQLDNVRRHIVNDAAPLRAVIADPQFVRAFGGLQGEQLKTAPQGYDREHPDIDLLRYKQFLATQSLSDELVASDGFVDHVLEVFATLKPFLVYLDEATRPVEFD